MAIEQPTTPPTITDLPPAPNSATDTPSEFDSKANIFVAGQVGLPPEQNTANTWVKETSDITYNNALESQTSATASAASATESEQSARDSEANANYVGLWSSLTGSLSIGVSVGHEGGIWRLNVNLADVTASEPSLTNTDWQLGLVRATDLQVEQGTQYTMPDSLQLNNFVKREWSSLTSPKVTGDFCLYEGGSYLIRNPVETPSVSPPDRYGRTFVFFDGVNNYFQTNEIDLQEGDIVEFSVFLFSDNTVILDGYNVDGRFIFFVNSFGSIDYNDVAIKEVYINNKLAEKGVTKLTGIGPSKIKIVAKSASNIGYVMSAIFGSQKSRGEISNLKVLRSSSLIYSYDLMSDGVGGFNLSIDPEFTYQENFNLGAGWSINDNSAVALSGSQSNLITRLYSQINAGSLVRIILDAVVDSGSLSIVNFSGGLVSSTGRYDQSSTINSNTSEIVITKSSDFSGSIKLLRVINSGSSSDDGVIFGSVNANFDRYWYKSDGNQQIKKTNGIVSLNDVKTILHSNNTYQIKKLSKANYGDEIVVVRSGQNKPTLVLNSEDIADGKLIEYGFQTDTELTLDTNDTYTLFFDGVNLQVRRG